MDREKFFLAFDFGTESLRGAVFNEEGIIVYTDSESYKTYFPKPGWAEQNPGEWWESFTKLSKKIIKYSGISPSSIPAISIDTTCCTVLALDKNFNPLRNAIIWMDVRSFKQAEKIANVDSQSLKYNGYGSVSAEWMPCKALWLKENEPEIYKKSKYICGFQDWVNYKLTGKYVGSINNTTVRWYYNKREGGWPEDFYREIGLSDVIDKFPQDILELGKPIGTITPEVAALTGFSKNTIVVQGGADAYIGMIGLGAIKPGRLAFITGSSHLMLGHTDKGMYQKGIFGAFPDCVMPGLYVVEGAQISSGSVLKWFKDQFVSSKYEKKAEDMGIGIYDYLNELAKGIKPGSEGLILLNYWQGNRNPLIDSQARGVIWGLSLKHTPIHIYRSIMEGVAFGTEHIMRYFKEAGFTPKEVYACGGATKSRLWMQIQSDVIGVPIYLTNEPNAPLLGGAILASYGSGYYNSIEDGVKKMVKVKEKIVPDIEKHKEYEYYVEKYIETYPRLKDLMHDMVMHESK